MRNEWVSDNMTGIAIVRVSSRKQESGISHETQESDIREYCERNGINLVEVRRMVESAKPYADRKKYTAAITHAVANDIRHVLFYMFDRESRNLTDNEANEKLVKAGVICLHYVRDNKVLHKDSAETDFFMRDIQAVTNKQFIRNLTGKVMDAMQKKAESGWFPSNHVPLGYVVAREKNAEGKERKRGLAYPVRDPNENNVRWVIREFELRAQGLSFQAIRDQIVAEGICPPSKAKSYNKSSVEQRTSHPFYAGRFCWQGVWYDGKHELIVPQSLVAAVQSVKRGIRTIRRDAEHGVFGGGWLKCAECGCNIMYDPKKKTLARDGSVVTHHYYHCSNGKKMHPTMAGLNITEAELWEQFDKIVESIELTPEIAKKVANALNAGHKSVVAAASAEIEREKAHIKECEAKEDNAYDNLMKGVLDQDSFKRQITRFRDERKIATLKLQDAQGRINGGFSENMQSTFELSKHAKTLYKSRSAYERRFFLEKVLSNQVLRKRTIEYCLRKPFEEIMKCREM